MNQASFLFHDYETFGADPKLDRPAQFAAIRTNADFEPIDEPVSILMKPVLDCLPDPVSCLITGLTPQRAEQEGLDEPAFFAEVHQQMITPRTCTLGFNSIRFDDEFTRHGFFRNFYEPYAREWQGGNSRFDLLDLTRMCYALRPEGIEWPEHAPGKPSFKLEHLARANRLTHSHAHEALSDVEATIGLCRLIRTHQPRLFDFLFELRDKRRAGALLDWAKRTPVLHSSSRIPAERGATTIVIPLAQHPVLPNGVIVFDLMSDPTDLLDLDIDDIRDRVFVDRNALPEDVSRIPLKVVHLNKAPALAPLSVLNGVNTHRIGLDPDRCARHALRLQAAEVSLASKVRDVFAPLADYPKQDAEAALYDGFLAQADQALLPKIRRAAPEALQELAQGLKDARLKELVFRFRARHAAYTLSPAEASTWQRFLNTRLYDAPDRPERSLPARLTQIAAMRHNPELRPQDVPILDAVEQWLRALPNRLGLSAEPISTPALD
ncbi:exodeoxyribonuclease I [Ahniella affigens]|uniref:Exodeoxyribonuclease I n=1 Tax=Ahniella affigens TaxID=2021234 RepID=A0A2P1PW51_9GAMM|nr:exodeoxyribonuclease I [Ahniella affigens]AVP99077.1 exodeoxyribonuclease I [Ahniella affigens]